MIRAMVDWGRSVPVDVCRRRHANLTMSTRRRPTPPSAAAVVADTDASPSADNLRLPWWMVAGVLVLLGVAAASNAFSAGFVFDSRQLILNDPRVHALTAENLAYSAAHLLVALRRAGCIARSPPRVICSTSRCWATPTGQPGCHAVNLLLRT